MISSYNNFLKRKIRYSIRLDDFNDITQWTLSGDATNKTKVPASVYGNNELQFDIDPTLGEGYAKITKTFLTPLKLSFRDVLSIGLIFPSGELNSGISVELGFSDGNNTGNKTFPYTKLFDTLSGLPLSYSEIINAGVDANSITSIYIKINHTYLVIKNGFRIVDFKKTIDFSNNELDENKSGGIENKLQMSTFEKWNIGAGISFDTSEKITGSQSMKIYSNTATTITTSINMHNNLSQGLYNKNDFIGLLQKATNIESLDSLSIKFGQYNSNGWVAGHFFEDTLTPTTDWNFIEKQFVYFLTKPTNLNLEETMIYTNRFEITVVTNTNAIISPFTIWIDSIHIGYNTDIKIDPARGSFIQIPGGINKKIILFGNVEELPAGGDIDVVFGTNGDNIIIEKKIDGINYEIAQKEGEMPFFLDNNTSNWNTYKASSGLLYVQKTNYNLGLNTINKILEGDFSFYINMRHSKTAEGGSGIVFEYTDDNNYKYIIANKSVTQYIMYEVLNGVTKYLNSFDAPSITSDFLIKLDKSGKEYKLSILEDEYFETLIGTFKTNFIGNQKVGFIDTSTGTSKGNFFKAKIINGSGKLIANKDLFYEVKFKIINKGTDFGIIVNYKDGNNYVIKADGDNIKICLTEITNTSFIFNDVYSTPFTVSEGDILFLKFQKNGKNLNFGWKLNNGNYINYSIEDINQKDEKYFVGLVSRNAIVNIIDEVYLNNGPDEIVVNVLNNTVTADNFTEGVVNIGFNKLGTPVNYIGNVLIEMNENSVLNNSGEIGSKSIVLNFDGSVDNKDVYIKGFKTGTSTLKASFVDFPEIFGTGEINFVLSTPTIDNNFGINNNTVNISGAADPKIGIILTLKDENNYTKTIRLFTDTNGYYFIPNFYIGDMGNEISITAQAINGAGYTSLISEKSFTRGLSSYETSGFIINNVICPKPSVELGSGESVVREVIHNDMQWVNINGNKQIIRNGYKYNWTVTWSALSYSDYVKIRDLVVDNGYCYIKYYGEKELANGTYKTIAKIISGTKTDPDKDNISRDPGMNITVKFEETDWR